MRMFAFIFYLPLFIYIELNTYNHNLLIWKIIAYHTSLFIYKFRVTITFSEQKVIWQYKEKRNIILYTIVIH